MAHSMGDLREPEISGTVGTRQVLASAGALVGGLIALVGLWRERARQRRQLRELPPHLLRDIGIDRLDALAEARKPFWRP